MTTLHALHDPTDTPENLALRRMWAAHDGIVIAEDSFADDLAGTEARAAFEKGLARKFIRHARWAMFEDEPDGRAQLQFDDRVRRARYHIANYLGYMRIAAGMRRRMQRFSQAAE